MKFEFRTSEGKVCCSSHDPTAWCEHCKAALAHARRCRCSRRVRRRTSRVASGDTRRSGTLDSTENGRSRGDRRVQQDRQSPCTRRRRTAPGLPVAARL
jgi:hypothetical protein